MRTFLMIASIVVLLIAYVVGVVFLRRNRAWLAYYLLAAFGLTLILVFGAQAIGLAGKIESLVTYGTAWLASLVGIKSQWLGQSQFMVADRSGWVVLQTNIECSALIESSILAGLIFFYPAFDVLRKIRYFTIGLVVTIVANTLRMLIIAGMTATLGRGAVFWGHAIVGRLFFFAIIIALYWFILTRPTVHEVAKLIGEDRGPKGQESLGTLMASPYTAAQTRPSVAEFSKTISEKREPKHKKSPGNRLAGLTALVRSRPSLADLAKTIRESRALNGQKSLGLRLAGLITLALLAVMGVFILGDVLNLNWRQLPPTRAPGRSYVVARTQSADGSITGIPADELTSAIDVKDDQWAGTDSFKAKISSDQVNISFKKQQDEYWITSSAVGFKKTGGTAEREILTYSDVMPGVDLKEKLYQNRLKEEIMVKNEQAATSFTFQLTHSEDLKIAQIGEAISYRDATSGDEIVKIEPPSAVDAKGKIYLYRYVLRGDLLTVEPAAGLAGAVYPLVIDPSYTVVTGALSGSTEVNGSRKLARSSNGDLHCVYYRLATVNNIFYAKSTNGGQTWTETALTTDTTYIQMRPSIAVDASNNLHVVWNGAHSGSPSNYQIRYIKYTAGGSWDASPTNLTSGSYSQDSPSIAVDSSNNLHVVWSGAHSGSPSNYQIRYIKYTAGGSWDASPTNLINEPSYWNVFASIAVDSSNNLHVVWYGYYSGSAYYQIRYIKYTVGSGWDASPTNLTSDSYHQYSPSITVDESNNLHVVWCGQHSTSTSIYQVRYKKYTVGTGWDASPTNLTSESTAGYDQYTPSIAIDSSNNLHVAWFGKYSGSTTYYQIRYKKYTAGTGWDASPTNLTSSATANQQYPILIWARWPNISGALTNRPKTGYAFIWADGTTVMYYTSSDLSWDTPAPSGTQIKTVEFYIHQFAPGVVNSDINANYGVKDVAYSADGATPVVTATVAVGSVPYGVGVNPTTNKIYVVNSGGNTVSVIDGTTDTVLTTVAVGSVPTGVGVNPTTNKIYVSNSSGASVSVIDGTDDASVDINLPEDGIVIRKAIVEWRTVIEGATNTGGESRFYRSGNFAFRSLLSLGSVTTDSTESRPLVFYYDVTSQILAGNNTYYFNGRIDTTVRNLDSAKIYITYEYSDNSATQLKTVRHFVGCAATQQASGDTDSYTVNPNIQESGASVQSSWIEMSGEKPATSGPTTDSLVNSTMNSNAFPAADVDNVNRTSYAFQVLNPFNSYYVNLTSNNTIGLVNNNYALNLKGASWVTTYSYPYYSGLNPAPHTRTARYFIGQLSGYLPTTTPPRTTVGSAAIYLPESSLANNHVYVLLTYQDKASGNITPEAVIGANSSVGSAYATVFYAGTGGGDQVLFDITTFFNTYWTQGSTLEIRANASVASSMEGVRAEVFITGNYDAVATTTGIKTVYWFLGQQTSKTTLDLTGTISTYFPESFKTKRSAAALSVFNNVALAAARNHVTTIDDTGIGGTDSSTVSFSLNAQPSTLLSSVNVATQIDSSMTPSSTLNFTISEATDNSVRGGILYTTYESAVPKVPTLGFVLLSMAVAFFLAVLVRRRVLHVRQ